MREPVVSSTELVPRTDLAQHRASRPALVRDEAGGRLITTGKG